MTRMCSVTSVTNVGFVVGWARVDPTVREWQGADSDGRVDRDDVRPAGSRGPARDCRRREETGPARPGHRPGAQQHRRAIRPPLPRTRGHRGMPRNRRDLHFHAAQARRTAGRRMLHPRTPATATVVAAAWRSVLDEAPGIFEVVADHPATIRALATAHRELRDLSDTALDAVRETSPLHAGLIELHRTATDRIADTFYDETDLLTAATELVLGRPDTCGGGVASCCTCRNDSAAQRPGSLAHLPPTPT